MSDEGATLYRLKLMGLDIYAGPLCRYYSGAWQTIIRQWGEQSGVPVAVVRPDAGRGLSGLLSALNGWMGRRRAPLDPVQAIVSWRAGLARQHRTSESEWDWPEDLGLPFETDKPDFDGYGAVQLWAAYAERPEVQRPLSMPKDFANDSILEAALTGSVSFDQILGPELWLPIANGHVFDAEDPAGKRIRIGSVFELKKQLDRLNQVTWNASDEAARNWREEEFDPENLESIARWGFSIWICLADFAVGRRLSLRLDY